MNLGHHRATDLPRPGMVLGMASNLSCQKDRLLLPFEFSYSLLALSCLPQLGKLPALLAGQLLIFR